MSLKKFNETKAMMGRFTQKMISWQWHQQIGNAHKLQPTNQPTNTYIHMVCSVEDKIVHSPNAFFVQIH